MTKFFLILILALALAGCTNAALEAERAAYQTKQAELQRVRTEEAKQKAEQEKQKEERRKIYAEQAKTADCGPLGNWKAVVKTAISAQLKDPDSAQYQFDRGEPTKTYTELKDGQVLFLWSAWARVNAKNSYGGYTGYKTYIVKFRDGKAFDVLSFGF